ncbi:hypothetical protein EV385_2395 [Krasilnikovia cinnamomea]|uniref:Uncharacterized protein n=1 Tax=Krasilnikovia cinnamomea TaxID=349313 RepID=A0A4Q7ZIE4_9ACTN|nr:hypothetical protein [Krasilnikovia cinnamomea]RZU50620.1 hypothetical protein EV385_2395 [Krasilnikovia cinnamomea]
MPDREPHQEHREGHSARLPRLLVWAGAGLAPAAATVALLGGDSSMRVAVLLLAVCVVLIGASLLIRSDPVLLRMDVEDRVAAEVETLREQLRAEVAAAARVTHHHVQTLQDELGQLRGAAWAEPGTTTGGRASVPAAVPHPAAGPTGSAPVPHGVTGSAGGGMVPHGATGPTGGGMVPHGATGPTGGGVVPHGATGPAGGGVVPQRAAVARSGLPRPRGPVPGPPPSVARPPRNPPIVALPPAGPLPAGPLPAGPSPGGRLPAGPLAAGPLAAGPMASPSPGVPAEGGGKRRADITAVDLGYTGRRTRPDDTHEEFDYGPEPGHPGYGVTAPDPYDADPLADEYDWRQPSGNWDQRGRW